MARLEDLSRGAAVRGVVPEGPVTVVAVEWHGPDVVNLTYRNPAGRTGEELLFRDREPALTIAADGKPWSFDADGDLLRLASEAHRISLAHLFDPLLAVHSSLVEPLPHQITAVYAEMLGRQPLRFLLADDPGAGKTIMAGLLIKELLIRGDLSRCLIVCPGALAEQWQDELYGKFQLPFEILTNDKLESARTGNWFQENPLAIARLDRLSRNADDVQAKLEKSDWDLVVVDEAHKMSASFFGGEVRYTKRYQLGQLLGRITRHFLLMTATPHNGKEEDFQLFLALLDGDRFEGKFRDGVHACDPADMMRRLTKEHLFKFDGRPLFPERRAYTANYSLSEAEAALYKAVTDYVKTEFNRADQLADDGRKGTVGFALTTLQRRLASSPEAIHKSLVRRRERLEKRLREERLDRRAGAGGPLAAAKGLPLLTRDALDDLEDAPEAEVEAAEDQVSDLATAARTIAELEVEIALLRRLEETAARVRAGRGDRKWDELSKLLRDNPEMFDAHGHRRKLVIFTEHRDTLNYLAERVRDVLGNHAAVVCIHGGVGRDDRRKIQDAFTQDKDVQILLATDAAGEGINLQRAHLMVNYDLPWNPNRLEQRFGRIHRIGQTEVCHLWNLVSAETREGQVYHRLLEKLDHARAALGGQVFDVLGRIVFEDQSLRELLIRAVRESDTPEVRDRLHRIVDQALDRDRLRQLLEDRALSTDSMDTRQVQAIRAEMERADARRLQPHYICSFFLAAFERLGGAAREREPGRYEITHVPAPVRNRDRQIGSGAPVMAKYERVTFDKTLINVPGRPPAVFVCSGHPLLTATIDLTLERHLDLLRRGAVLVDPADRGDRVRALVYLEHAIQDARSDRTGQRRVVSRRLQFVEIDDAGAAAQAGYAPYLDYRPITPAERAAVEARLRADWLTRDLEKQAVTHAITQLVPPHLAEVKTRKLDLIARTRAAVRDRLTKEIHHWAHRADQLRAQEEAGQSNSRMNSDRARQRAKDLEARLQRRLEDLDQEGQLSPLPPVVVGGALVVPAGLLPQDPGGSAAADRARVEALAMRAVLAAERALGFDPRDVSTLKVGYDIESKSPLSGALRFLEVKGRAAGAATVCVTRNEILTAFNKPDEFILAVVEVAEDGAGEPRYVRRPFRTEPDFGVTSVNYELPELLKRATAPS